MSQENVEMVRHGYGRWIATGEFSPELIHPDFVWDMSTFRGWPERQTYVGLEGLAEFLAAWVQAWQDGQSIRMQMYASPAETLEAAGLSE